MSNLAPHPIQLNPPSHCPQCKGKAWIKNNGGTGIWQCRGCEWLLTTLPPIAPCKPSASAESHPFTVIMMLPDYRSETFGQDSFLAHVDAADAAEASIRAQRQAASTLSSDNTDGIPEDFHVVAVFAGHLQDLNPR